MNYLDFDLRIDPGNGEEYPVALLNSPAGIANASMHFPFNEQELKNHLNNLQIALLREDDVRRRVPLRENQVVRDFGQQLFDALIVDEIRSHYDRSQVSVAQQGFGLRLRLHILVPNLATLPWEYLYDSRQAEFVCLSRNTQVVRYVGPSPRIQPLVLTAPLRILGVVASPNDRNPFDIEREKELLQESIEDLEIDNLVELTWLSGQTWRELQEYIEHGPWHVFHFIGYGTIDSNSSESVIAFVSDGGGSHLVNATQLGRLLADHGSLRLVLLNAAEGVQTCESDIFSSTAATLLQQGIASVVTVQYEFTDPSTVAFASTLYKTLAAGTGVDSAVKEAREAINSEDSRLEWGIPVLYSCSPDEVLFQLIRKPNWGFKSFPPIRLVIFILALISSIVFFVLLKLNIWSNNLNIFLSLFSLIITLGAWLFPLPPTSQRMSSWFKRFFFKRLHRFSQRRRELLKGLGLIGIGFMAGWGVPTLLEKLQSASETITPSLIYSFTFNTTPLPLGITLFANRSIQAIAWSPDGKRIACASVDKTVRLWDAFIGRPIFTYHGHSDAVNAVAWSPDGKYIASASADGVVHVWVADTGVTTITYTGHSKSVTCLTWSPNRKFITSGSQDKTVQLWDAATGGNVLIYHGHSDAVNAVAWSPDGKRIASASTDQTVQLWDAATNGGNLFTYHGHSDAVNAVAWSPDGKYIASGDGGTSLIESRSFIDSGFFIGVTVQVWNATTGDQFLIFRSHSATVNAVAWSPDGKYIASASVDKTVQLWNFIHTFFYRGHFSQVNAVAWSPDGKYIASASADGVVHVWVADTGTHIYTYHGHSDAVNAVAWSPDGKRIASASTDQTVQLWDAATGGNVFTYHGHSDAVNAVAWSPDGKRIASASADKTVHVWDAADGILFYNYHGHSDAVNAVAWSPDGKRIASASTDKTVHVWDAATGGNVFTYHGHSDAVNAVAWSPDGKRIASASADQTVQLWDAATGGNDLNLTNSYYFNNISAVNAVAWSPDGKRIATGGNDKTVLLGEADLAATLFDYLGHSAKVNAVAWSPDGKRIASASADQTVQLWQRI
jgi:WD40 repeat protein